MCRRALLLALGLAASACDETVLEPRLLEVRSPRLTLGLEVSTADAPTGGRIEVALGVGASGRVGLAAVQGRLRFDPARLRFVGPIPEASRVVLVNDAAQGEGELRVLAFSPRGLGRRAAVLGFEVLAPEFTAGLSLEPEAVVRLDRTEPGWEVDRRLREDPTLTAAGAPRAMSTEDWARHLGYTPTGAELAPPPGGYRIGDCSSDGTIDIFDVLAIANINVGIASPPTDPAQFRACDVGGDGTIDIFDVLDIATFNVGLEPPSGSPIGFGYRPLAAGAHHSCALTALGHAWCWGSDYYGQLGNDAGLADQPGPVPVAGGHVFLTLTAGAYHTCGLDVDGVVWCWGYDQFGQLGDGSAGGFHPTPVQVAGAPGFVTVAAGRYHTCALSAAGLAYCWGSDVYGQLGDGAPGGSRPTPSQVTGALAFTSLASGAYHTCALDGAGRARCWGFDGFGQLGNGTPYVDQPGPSLVAGSHTFILIAPGGSHTCGLVAGGAAWCWGWNPYGQLGNGTPDADQPSPVQVSGGRAFTTIASGEDHTCAVDSAGQAWCWGWDGIGQVGDGFPDTDRPTPVAVSGSQVFLGLAGGFGHTCGTDTSRRTWCWGYDEFGQLGNGSPNSTQYAPVRVGSPF